MYEASVSAVAASREDGAEVPTTVRGVGEGFNFGELRQRNVNGSSSEDLAASSAAVGCDGAIGRDDGSVKVSPEEKPMNEPDRNGITRLETVESLDWKRLMAEDPNCEYCSYGPCSACFL